jgi:hypothetical protein
MGAQITPMKNGDSYGSPFFIGVICAPIGVFCVSILLTAASAVKSSILDYCNQSYGEFEAAR